MDTSTQMPSGRVVNRRALADKAFRYGIHFEKITPDERATIADFINVFFHKDGQ